MRFDNRALLRIETPGLVEHGQRNRRLAQIVKHRRRIQSLHVAFRQTEAQTEIDGDAGDQETMLKRPFVVAANGCQPSRTFLFQRHALRSCGPRPRAPLTSIAVPVATASNIEAIAVAPAEEASVSSLVATGAPTTGIAPVRQRRKQFGLIDRTRENECRAQCVGLGDTEVDFLVQQEDAFFHVSQAAERCPERLDILDNAKIRLDHDGAAVAAPDLGGRQQFRGDLIFSLKHGRICRRAWRNYQLQHERA